MSKWQKMNLTHICTQTYKKRRKEEKEEGEVWRGGSTREGESHTDETSIFKSLSEENVHVHIMKQAILKYSPRV